jgi:hypothetical protein
MSTPITFWIKSSRDKSGWPYGGSPFFTIDASDPDAFDAVMRQHAGEGSTAYVGPGTFMTCGIFENGMGQVQAPGFRMQSGARLIGSGATTLKLAKCNADYGAVVVGSNSVGTHGISTTARDMVVSDIDIDGNAEVICSPNENRPWFIQGVQLFGVGGCRIERVNVKNVCGTGVNGAAPKTENFILCINSPAGGSTGNVIRSCTVSDFYNPSGNGCCSAIGMYCQDAKGTITGEIADCHVHLNGERGWGFGGEFAYNCSNSQDLTLVRCSSKGAQRGFNNDTWPNKGLLVQHCHFDVPAGNCIGILLKKANPASEFWDNTILLRSANSVGVQIERDGNGEMTFITNRFIAVGAWTGKAISFNCQSNADPDLVPLNVTLRNNSVEFASNATIDTLVTPAVGNMRDNLVNGDVKQWPVEQPNVIA